MRTSRSNSSIFSHISICSLLVLSSLHLVASFLFVPLAFKPQQKYIHRLSSLKAELSDEHGGEREVSDEASIPETEVTVRIDDRGSDLTNRFKFKVNALMGNFDPNPEDGPDDDKQVGNIFNAMMCYPNQFTFTLVGKVNPDNYEEETKKLVNDIKEAIASVLMETTKEEKDNIIKNMEVSTIPRGKKFAKISLKVMVNDSNEISMIYDSLSAVETIVMKF